MPNDAAGRSLLTSPCAELSIPATVRNAPITARRVALFGAAAGAIVLNVFAGQALVGLVGTSLGLGGHTVSLVPAASLLGYAAGLFLLVPLADRVENRRLILRTLLADALALAAAAVAPTAGLFLLAAFLAGMTATAIQMLVPLAAVLSPPERRGRVVGNVMSGVMLGIMLSRPIASVIAGAYGWRVFYLLDAALILGIAWLLGGRLPRLAPSRNADSYRQLIVSLWTLLRSTRVLQRRALSAALCMAAFSVFWTVTVLRLAAPPFTLGPDGIALFALAGASGVVAAPLAGATGDRGWVHGTLHVSHAAILAAVLAAAWAGGPLASGHAGAALILLAGLAALLDAGVTGDQTIGRRAVNLLASEARARLNGLFVGLFFLGGAIGTALAGPAWAAGGWPLACGLAAIFAIVAFLVRE